MPKLQTVAQRRLFLWDEVNRLNSALIEFEKTTEEAEEEFVDFLLDAYIEGFAAANYLLGGEADPTEANIVKAVNKSYDGKTIREKFLDYYGHKDAEKIKRLVESEFHRMSEQGGFDAASAYGGNVKKRWSAILDSKTRDTHFILDGTEVGLKDKFYSISGDSAYFPGGFDSAEENANCRCLVEYIAE